MKPKWNRGRKPFRRGFASFAVALASLLLCGTGCVHERKVVRRNPSSISFGVRGGAVHESGRPRKDKMRKRTAYNPDEKLRRPLKNQVPGLENPSGKPQDINMDSLRSILTGSPSKGNGGSGGSMPPASTSAPSSAPAASLPSVPQMRSVPLPTR